METKEYPAPLVPVNEPKVKTGSGKATIKTATSAAKTACAARDEAKAAVKAVEEITAQHVAWLTEMEAELEADMARTEAFCSRAMLALAIGAPVLIALQLLAIWLTFNS